MKFRTLWELFVLYYTRSGRAGNTYHMNWSLVDARWM